jgi:hypothetical protein
MNKETLLHFCILFVMSIVFALGYRLFFHGGEGSSFSFLLKIICEGFLIILIATVGYFGCGKISKTAKDLWLWFYSVFAILMSFSIMVRSEFNLTAINETFAELKLFFSSPLPYGIILLFKKQISASDPNS